MKRALRWSLWIVLMTLLVGGGVGGYAFWRGWRLLTTPYQGFAGEEIFVTIPPGSSGSAILSRLAATGVLQIVYGLDFLRQGQLPPQAGLLQPAAGAERWVAAQARPLRCPRLLSLNVGF
ncbi:MAG TPA: hypothetical protein PKM64_06565, partial [Thermoanaerobaculia bacterium]|nr:hypothetical protein [Thermoanaerobaculia bacterium]